MFKEQQSDKIDMSIINDCKKVKASLDMRLGGLEKTNPAYISLMETKANLYEILLMAHERIKQRRGII